MSTTPTGDAGRTPRLDPDPPGAHDARFGPDAAAPAAGPTELWEPGVVEIVLREGVRPQIVAPDDAGPPTVQGADDGLDDLNSVLRQYELRSAEPSFQVSAQAAADARATAERGDLEVPGLDSFVTLRFGADTDTVEVAARLRELDDVDRAVPVPRALPPRTPLDEPLVGTTDQVVVDPVTGLEKQWYAFRCNVDQAWNLATGDGVVIADIDWGYRVSHQDLAANLDLTRAFNSFDGGTNVSHGTSIYHGTGVMGLAGAADNDRGMAGMAFEASLWPVQANSGPGAPQGGNAWARAIEWVRTTSSGGRRKVIILEVQTGSFGNYEMVPSVNAAIRLAIADGVVVCVAAGNGNRDAGLDDLGNPIPVTGSILVGATAYHPTDDVRAGFSNFGPRVVVCAPGDTFHDLTCSSSADDMYRNGFGGTSGATPKVAATAALMLSIDPALTHAEIATILNQTGTTVVTDPAKPVGMLLDCAAAVIRARTSELVRARTPKVVTEGWHRVTFPSAFASPPVVLTSIETFEGSDPAGTRLRSVTGSGFEVMVEEERSRDDETTHVAEVVGYVAVERGPVLDEAGATVGEAGTVTVAQDDGAQWHAVHLAGSYTDPVVLAQVMTYDGTQPCHARLRNVTATSFELQIEEWDYLDQKHLAETVGYLVLERGRHTLPSRTAVDVGRVDADHTWTAVSFGPGLSTAPVTLSRSQTYAGRQAIVTRQRNVAASGFEVRVQEEEANDQTHLTESIGYVAVD